MDIQLIADTGPKRMSFEDGVNDAITLLKLLSRLPEFSSGWEADGILLSSNEEEFIDLMRQENGFEADQISEYTVVARSGRRDVSEEFEPEKYLGEIEFGGDQILPNRAELGLQNDLVTLDFCKRVIRILLEWSSIYHVKICDTFYHHEDSPLDARRRGIGWAGWVPFHLTPEQVPEAVVLEPLEGGTFVACQNRWITADWESIQRAQALELRLNGLGVLPTFEDLAKGNWGKS